MKRHSEITLEILLKISVMKLRSVIGSMEFCPIIVWTTSSDIITVIMKAWVEIGKRSIQYNNALPLISLNSEPLGLAGFGFDEEPCFLLHGKEYALISLSYIADTMGDHFKGRAAIERVFKSSLHLAIWGSREDFLYPISLAIWNGLRRGECAEISYYINGEFSLFGEIKE